MGAFVLVAGDLKPIDIHAFGLVRTQAGLLYSTDFEDLSGWVNDGNWTSVAAPMLVSFGKLPITLFDNTGGASTEVNGVREPQILVEDDTWWLIYDAGDTSHWRQFLASSTDGGLTWTRRGEIVGLDNGIGGEYAGVATGWLEKRGDTYYLHRVTAGTTYPSPNIGLPASPYRWDTWSADSPLGPWTFIMKNDPPAGTWASSTYLAGSVSKHAGVYHCFVQGKGSSGSYKAGRATAFSPSGPWSVAPGPLWSTSVAGTRTLENPKVFFHPGLNRWILLANAIAASGDFTDRNFIAISESFDDWSVADCEFTQGIGPIDTTGSVVGVQVHLTGPDGALIQDPVTGRTPYVYDASPTSGAPGFHFGRKIHGSVLEPSPAKAAFSSAVATSKTITRALAHGDIEAEFVVRFNNTTIDTNVGFWFRQDGAGHGYRLVVRNGQRLLLEKAVGVTIPTVQDPVAGNSAGDHTHNRIRVRATGTTIQAWLDGQLQINITDTSFATGTHIALSGFAANVAVRSLSIRAGTTITVTGLDAGAHVVLRSYGGLPVEQVTANGSGVATFTTVTHGPHAAFEIDGGSARRPPGGIWPGDSYELTS